MALSDDLLRAELRHTLHACPLEDPAPYRGKVRDTYRRGDRLALVTTDRLSAFDRVLTTIPFKGQVLTRLARFWLEATARLVPNHLLAAPDPQVLVGRAARALPVEFVVRGYVTGSLWRDVEAGRAAVYGVPLPSGVQRDERLPEPIVTPTTKAAAGAHDAPTSRAALHADGTLDAETFDRCAEAALSLYRFGAEHCARRGLLLVDTKYELGFVGDALVVIDEVHTPDSSRFWVADGYEARQRAGAAQVMLDKENIRRWLLAQGWSGDGAAPEIPEAERLALARTYVDACERIVGEPFVPVAGPHESRVAAAVGAALA